MADKFELFSPFLDDPFDNISTANFSDTVDLPFTSRYVMIGGAGALKVTTKGGQTVTLTGLAVGFWHKMRVTRIWVTGTAATNIAYSW